MKLDLYCWTTLIHSLSQFSGASPLLSRYINFAFHVQMSKYMYKKPRHIRLFKIKGCKTKVLDSLLLCPMICGSSRELLEVIVVHLTYPSHPFFSHLSLSFYMRFLTCYYLLIFTLLTVPSQREKNENYLLLMWKRFCNFNFALLKWPMNASPNTFF